MPSIFRKEPSPDGPRRKDARRDSLHSTLFASGEGNYSTFRDKVMDEPHRTDEGTAARSVVIPVREGEGNSIESVHRNTDTPPADRHLL
jgi:hypothetical protein